ncbi:MAG: hypothetical protein ACR2RV_16310, partial [Verrucomicrobiales bacterium]
MIKIESVLQRQLAPIIERRQLIHKRRRLTAVFLVVAVLELMVILGTDLNSPWTLLPVAVGIVLNLVLKVAFRPREIDLRKIAREIESDNPELKALLVTAVEQEDGSGELGFLQERVVNEASREAIAAQWGDTIDVGAQRGWRVMQGIACTLMVAAGVWMLGVSLRSHLPGGSNTSPAAAAELQAGGEDGAWQVEVEPGDVELELGSRLLVVARFGDRVPSSAQVELMLGDTGRTVRMEQNLTDPVFSAAVPEVSADGTYRISYGDGVTRDFQITTYVLPEVERVDVVVEAPPATDLPTKSIEDTRRVTVLEGSTIRLAIHTNLAAPTGRLVGEFVGDETDFELVPDSEDPSILVAELTPEEDSKLRIHLADAAGRKNSQPPLFSIGVKRNLPPKIELAFPGSDTEVSPIQEISAEATVWDDVQVAAAGASYQFGSEVREIIFDASGFKPDRKELVSTVLDFEELGAQPNDLLTYFFWAEDVAADGKPRRVSSDLRFAEVRHFEEIFREQPSQGGQEQQQQQGQQGEGQGGGQSGELLEKQKEILNATWKLKRLITDSTESLVEDAAVIHEGQMAVIEMAEAAAAEVTDAEISTHLTNAMREMRSAADQLDAIGDADDAEKLDLAQQREQAAYAALLHMRAREFQVTQSSQQSSSSSSQSKRQQQQLSNMELKEEEKRYETQRLADEQREEQRAENREDLQILNRLKELAHRQEGITDQIQELEAMLVEAQTEEEEEKIRRELKRLEEEQREMVADLDELNERMEQEENRGRTAEERERLADARESAQQAAESLESERLDEAANAGTRAAREFEDLADEFRERTANQFAEEMQDARRQARELAEAEREIGEKIDERSREDRTDRSEVETQAENAKLNEEIAAQGQELERLLEHLGELSEQAEEGEP